MDYSLTPNLRQNDELKIIESPSLALEYIEIFETVIADTQNASWGVSVNSCTSGLLVSLLAIGLEKGDEVIIPPFSWPQTYFPAKFLGANLVPIDSSPAWPVMDPLLIERAITSRTKAVISVGLWGFPVGINEINETCRKKGIYHILDAAQLFNANRGYGGIGTLADLTVLSFGNTKKDIRLGEGGIVLGNSQVLRDRILFLTQHPFRIHKDVENQGLIEINDGQNFNFRIHPLSAYFGIQKLNNGESQKKEIKKQKELIQRMGILEIGPPDYWEVSESNYTTILVDANSISINTLKEIKEELLDSEYCIRSCPYKVFSELSLLNTEIPIPWYGDGTKVKKITGLLPESRSWLKKIMIVSKTL